MQGCPALTSYHSRELAEIHAESNSPIDSFSG